MRPIRFETDPPSPHHTKHPQVFISFITSTANDICRSSKRQVCVCE